MIGQRYEYKIERLGRGILWIKNDALENYKDVIDKYARDGWRLAEILAVGTGPYGTTKFIDLVFEREV